MTSTTSDPVALDKVTLADFEARQGDSFHLAGPVGDIVLRLADVKRVGRADRDGGAFSLIFVGPRGPFLPQAIYSISNDHMGRLEIFIVPIGPVDDGNGYEAIFA